MRDFLPCQSVLLAVLVSSVAIARGPYDKVVIRTETISDHPASPTSSVYVSGQVATVLRFEKDVDPAKTNMLGWEGRFEPILVGSKKVVIEPIRDLNRDEAVPRLVTLVDGTEIPFIVPFNPKYAQLGDRSPISVFSDGTLHMNGFWMDAPYGPQLKAAARELFGVAANDRNPEVVPISTWMIKQGALQEMLAQLLNMARGLGVARAEND